jgi:hypothetical protein
MNFPPQLKSVFLPPAKADEHDTGLRFTDILFGFVITQIFLRLQNWGDLPGYVRWQLVVSAALVLGSWIGFRGSLNRSSYKLKFFNLPLVRFIVDQLMIVLYFRIAVLTPNDANASFDPETLTNATLETLLFVFALYAVWDVIGLLMGLSGRYAESKADWLGFVITLAFAALFGGLFHVACQTAVDDSTAVLLLAGATALLLAYRWVKEIRSTFKPDPETTEPGGDDAGRPSPA